MATLQLSRTESLVHRDIQNGFSGIALSISHNNQLIHQQHYGYARRFKVNGEPLSDPEPLHPEMLFDIASLTKIFATTYALMYLYERNAIALDAPITAYLPNFKLVNSHYIPSIKDLLSHCAGLAPETRFYNDIECPELFTQARSLTTEVLLTQLSLVTEPQKHCVYSDNGMMVLGLLIEELTGKRLDELMDDIFYTPLNLQRTAFNPLKKGFSPDEVVATQVDGHRDNGYRTFQNQLTHTLRGEVHDEKALYSMEGIAGHAGLFSSLADTAKLTTLLTQPHSFFSQNTLKLFAQPCSANASFGLGFRLAHTREMRPFFGEHCSLASFGHLGFTGCALLVDPIANLSIVLLGNSVHSPILYPRQFLGKTYPCGRYSAVFDAIYEDLALQKP